MNKIGIMGGTFNPIHYGHLFLAENAYEQAGLDKVLFMPSKNPPHKAKPSLVTEQQRVDMIKLAIDDNPHFEISDLELLREGMTFTADTLEELVQINPDKEYYFIVGADSLFMMQNWYKPQSVFDHCVVLAAGRDHAEEATISKQIELLEHTFGARILYVKMPTIQIASAQIRERLQCCRSVRYYVPDAVEEYISRNHLYINLENS
jgi:nicotinate (nicotinamide) nucleotide adenylyltransferase